MRNGTTRAYVYRLGSARLDFDGIARKSRLIVQCSQLTDLSRQCVSARQTDLDQTSAIGPGHPSRRCGVRRSCGPGPGKDTKRCPVSGSGTMPSGGRTLCSRQYRPRSDPASHCSAGSLRGGRRFGIFFQRCRGKSGSCGSALFGVA